MSNTPCQFKEINLNCEGKR